jgi:hypothetical protein
MLATRAIDLTPLMKQQSRDGVVDFELYSTTEIEESDETCKQMIEP